MGDSLLVGLRYGYRVIGPDIDFSYSKHNKNQNMQIFK